MSNYSSGITAINGTSAYPTDAQVDLALGTVLSDGSQGVPAFNPYYWMVSSEGGSATSIAFSFDGKHDHGVLTVGGNYTTFPMPMQNRKQMWLRAVTAVGTEKYQVIAWH